MISGVSIQNTANPTITFTYSDYSNAVPGSPVLYKYPRLTQIDNGYGGTLAYTYETDGRANYWLNYRVKTVNVNTGVATAAVKNYLYSTPVYDGSNALTGYQDVTEVTSNGATALAYTIHQFGTVGLDIGNELSTFWRMPIPFCSSRPIMFM